jgi:hypothetical protein
MHLCRPRSYEGITGKIRLHLSQRLLCRRRAHIKISKFLSSFARYPDHLKMQPYAVWASGAIHDFGGRGENWNPDLFRPFAMHEPAVTEAVGLRSDYPSRRNEPDFDRADFNSLKTYQRRSGSSS